MSRTPTRLAGIMAVVLLWAPASPAMADEALIAAVADGAPWITTGPNGRQMTITFFPDGSAQMRLGIMSRKMSWQPYIGGDE